MEFDAISGSLVLVGGDTVQTFTGDAWLWTPTPAAALATGPGCSGLGAPPSLATLGAPLVGQRRFTLDINGASASVPGCLAIAAGPGSSSMGPACTLWLDPSTLVAGWPLTTTAFGFSSLTLRLPPLTSLLGARLFAQSATIEAGATSNGIALSNAMQLTLGN